MSRTKYFIQEGFIVKKYNNDDKDVPGLFSLDKWFKRELTRYHVPFFDDCCPDAEGSEFVPAVFNTLTGETLYYDSNTEEYVPAEDWVAPTTTTTTAAPTTTTTTAAPTTTTTTAAPTTTTTTTVPVTTTTTTT